MSHPRFRNYLSLIVRTWRPLYIPQYGQTICGCFISPQSGHDDKLGIANRWCDRRMLRFDFDVFLFGTVAIISFLLCTAYVLACPFPGKRLLICACHKRDV